jgi:hypothetical protein
MIKHLSDVARLTDDLIDKIRCARTCGSRSSCSGPSCIPYKEWSK